MSTTPIKIFVADDISDTGLQPLRDAGFVVEKRTGLKTNELLEALAGCAGLVVRSETKVTADLLDGAAALRSWDAPASALTTSMFPPQPSAASS